MTIDEAIELLRLYEHAACSIARDDFLEALQQGIEALLREQSRRKYLLPDEFHLLPGETKE